MRIKAFGLYVILLGFIELFFAFFEKNYDVPVIPEIIGGLLVIGGIGILFLRKEARILILSVFSVVGSIVIGVWLFIFIRICAASGFSSVQDCLKAVGTIIFMLVFFGFPIAYLSLPKVKEQFR